MQCGCSPTPGDFFQYLDREYNTGLVGAIAATPAIFVVGPRSSRLEWRNEIINPMTISRQPFPQFVVKRVNYLLGRKSPYTSIEAEDMENAITSL
jgi:hypothetical protein